MRPSCVIRRQILPAVALTSALALSSPAMAYATELSDALTDESSAQVAITAGLGFDGETHVTGDLTSDDSTSGAAHESAAATPEATVSTEDPDGLTCDPDGLTRGSDGETEDPVEDVQDSLGAVQESSTNITESVRYESSESSMAPSADQAKATISTTDIPSAYDASGDDASSDVKTVNGAQSASDTLSASDAPLANSIQLTSGARRSMASRKAANELADDPVNGCTFVMDSSLAGRGVIDVKSGSTAAGANVQLYESNGTDAQKWEFAVQDDGTYVITNTKSGMALDVQWGNAKNGANVWQYTRNDSLAQRWRLEWVDESSGKAILHSALNDEFVLDAAAGKDANGTNLQIYTKNGTAAQIWNLIDIVQGFAGTVDPVNALGATAGVLAGDGTFAENSYVLTSVSANRAMDIRGASTATGAAVQLYARNGTIAQGFYLSREQVKGTTYYRIRNDKSALSITVDKGDIVAGTALTQEKTVEGNLFQLWRLVANDSKSSTYYLVNAGTLHALAASGSTLTTADVAQGVSSQLWSFTPWSPTIKADTIYRISSGVGGTQSLDVKNASFSEKGNIQNYAWNGTNAQRWYVSKTGNSYYLRNVGSGLYLSYSSDGNVIQSQTKTPWNIVYLCGGNSDVFGYRLESSQGNVADVTWGNSASGTNVRLYASNGTKAQTWSFSAVDAFIGEGWFELAVAGNRNLRLDVSGGSGASGANVQIYSSNNTGAQKWHITSMGNGWYRIIGGDSNRALAIGKNNNVVQSTTSAAAGQLWKISYGEKGFVFTNKKENLVLDIAGGVLRTSTNVQVYRSNNTAAQAWLLKPCAPTELGSAIETFSTKMVAIANDKKHGYDQIYRWGEKGDYDCSSLVIACLKKAGFGTGTASYTGNMRSNLTKRGWEIVYTKDVHALQAGDILLADDYHTAGIVSNTMEVAAHVNERGGATGGKPGDQTGKEICTRSLSEYASGGGTRSAWWDIILRPTKKSSC